MLSNTRADLDLGLGEIKSYLDADLSIKHPIILELADTQARGLGGMPPTVSGIDEKDISKLLKVVNMTDFASELKKSEKYKFVKGGTTGTFSVKKIGTDTFIVPIATPQSLYTFDQLTKTLIDVTVITFFYAGRIKYKLESNYTANKVTRQLFMGGSQTGEAMRDVTKGKAENPGIPGEIEETYNYNTIPCYVDSNGYNFQGFPQTGWYLADNYIDQLIVQDNEFIREIKKRKTKIFVNQDLESPMSYLTIGNTDSFKNGVATQLLEKSFLSDFYFKLDGENGINSLVEHLTDQGEFIKAYQDGIAATINRIKKAVGQSDASSMGSSAGGNPAGKTTSEISFYREDTASTLTLLANNRSDMLRELFKIILMIAEANNIDVGGVVIDDLILKCNPNLEVNENAKFNLLKEEFDNGLLTLVEFIQRGKNIPAKDAEKWLNNNYDALNSRLANYSQFLANDSVVDKTTKLNYLFKNVLDDKTIADIIQKATDEKPASPFGGDDMMGNPFGGDDKKDDDKKDDDKKDDDK